MLIAQITDLHLGFDPINPDEFNRCRLDAVLAALRDLSPRPDLMLVTGDIANDGDDAQSYARYAEAIADLPFPVWPLMGNHDSRAPFLKQFPETPSAGGFIQYAIDDHPLRILVLDTLEAGRHGGAFCETRAAWLAARLDEAPERPTLIALHHPPIATGIPWLTEDPDAAWAREARSALGRSLTAENLAAERRYLMGEGRETFERPYGLAWLLQLAAELRGWDDPEAQAWSESLRPLEAAAADRLRSWLPKLSHPIRTGEHSQTAFAFGLALDWARSAGDDDLERLLTERSRALYLGDRDCPLGYEPSGQDFLSPCLAEADLMRRLLVPAEYAAWLGRFLPDVPLPGEPGADGSWLVPAVVTDPTDGKLAHLDGLNLSRAWMLEGIAAGLPADDPRRGALLAAAAEHRRSGLASVTGAHYEGGHWLGSFAAYLVTGRGLAR